MMMKDSKVIQLEVDQVLEDLLLRIGLVLVVLQQVVEGNQKVEFLLEDFSRKIKIKIKVQVSFIEIRKKSLEKKVKVKFQ